MNYSETQLLTTIKKMKLESSFTRFSVSGIAFLTGIAAHLYWKKRHMKKEAGKQVALEMAHEIWNSSLFFPSRSIRIEDPRSSLSRLESYLNCAQLSIKVCVMTISDGRCRRLTDVLVSKHNEGVLVQIYTAANTKGTIRSLRRFKKHGIEARYKKYKYSTTIHHKFIIIDDFFVITGSLNWTSCAVEFQNENLVVVNDPRIVPKYCARFDCLWNIYDTDVATLSDT